MKTKPKSLLLLIAPLVLCGCVVRDETGIDTGAFSGYGDDSISISTVKYGQMDRVRGSVVVDYSKYQPITGFETSKEYWLVYDFSYAPGKDNLGNFELSVTFTYIGLNGPLDFYELDSTALTEKTSVDVRGTPASRLSAKFRVPDVHQEYYFQRVVLLFAPSSVGEGTLAVTFSTNAGTLIGGGASGTSHVMKVQ